MSTVEVLVLDVNETLSDLEPLRERFTAAGLPAESLDTWFAATLRDGFALTAAGASAEFGVVGRDVLVGLLSSHGLDAGDEAVRSVLSGLTELSLHPDVLPGLQRLRELGLRLVTLTNGSAAMSERMFTAGGIEPLLEHRLDVSTPGLWKPHPDSYRYASGVCGVPVGRMALVAVHPWDIDGARRAGLQGYYLDRRSTPYPRAFKEPDLAVPDLIALADAVAVKIE
ncbi:haloacid dehalogenase type II [Kribbella sp. NPDC050124]|uniref:haloacid dehalogenase type II n=1 Tax=Kribbella sp. NPDC050124 TaxID=3364114 RepID=UPI00378EF9D1